MYFHYTRFTLPLSVSLEAQHTKSSFGDCTSRRLVVRVHGGEVFHLGLKGKCEKVKSNINLIEQHPRENYFRAFRVVSVSFSASTG